MTYDEAKNEYDHMILPRSADVLVKFYLFTSNNPSDGELIYMGDKDQFRNSNFNPNHPTRFIIHGWMSSVNSTMNILIRDAYLKHGKHNIIVIDWSSAAINLNYVAARFKVENVGKQVAELIDFLNNYAKLSFNDIHLIGHSLGAHVCGFIGKNVKNGRIPIIFGLDPALPLFQYIEKNKRLSNDDAFYVETIHTNGGFLGFMDPIGISSFYPNYGSQQPGCGLDLGRKCSHERSFELFADAIENDYFIPRQCNTFDDLVNQNCNNIISKDIKMGSYLNAFRNAKGIFYLPTSSSKPFRR
ncbi:endothelial lipase-like [Condylostylus longicornis]|uniref:endothelial lipase-like n=1 Tax=Condylostylus longicornis TaxID=2530218 RepID=UPI00244E40BB|nr:endothelial lipase-like [Condylostylus longicornis]